MRGGGATDGGCLLSPPEGRSWPPPTHVAWRAGTTHYPVGCRPLRMAPGRSTTVHGKVRQEHVMASDLLVALGQATVNATTLFAANHYATAEQRQRLQLVRGG